MKTLLFTSVFAVTLLFTGCVDCVQGTGESLDESRIVEPFTSIDVRSAMDVTLTNADPGASPKVIITAQSNLMPKIKAEVRSGQLVIETDGCITSTDELKAVVIVSNLEKIINDGSADIRSSGTITTAALEIINHGTGDVSIAFEGDYLEIEQSGSGAMSVKGNTDAVEIDSRGSGNVQTVDLRSNKADVNNSGSGDVDVTVMEELSIKLSGSGNVTYKGNPQEIDQKTTGSGEVIRR